MIQRPIKSVQCTVFYLLESHEVQRRQCDCSLVLEDNHSFKAMEIF